MRTVEIDGRPYRTLGAEDTVVHLALHAVLCGGDRLGCPGHTATSVGKVSATRVTPGIFSPSSRVGMVLSGDPVDGPLPDLPVGSPQSGEAPTDRRDAAVVEDAPDVYVDFSAPEALERNLGEAVAAGDHANTITLIQK